MSVAPGLAFPEIVPGRPALVLAPMEGVMDAPMRAMMSELGPLSYGVAEFLRVSQEVPPRHVFLRHVPEFASGLTVASANGGWAFPLQIQLLGGDPERLAGAAAVAVGLGARAIDLNFGCP